MAASLTNEAEREDLLVAVERALWQYGPVRSDDMPVAVALLDGGTVRVSGVVRSRIIRDGVVEVVRSVPGVQKVIDKLRTDPDLEVAIARALLLDSGTAHLPPGSVQIHGHRGTMVLVGRLPKEPDRKAVLRVAQAVDGVQQVIDRMTVADGR